MSKAEWLQKHFAKKTYRTELEKIPEYNPQFRRPGSHLPSLNKYPLAERQSKSHVGYDIDLIDRKLRSIVRRGHSKSSQHVGQESGSSNPETMKLTFMKPDKLPKIVEPQTPNYNSHGLSQILNNRNSYINGYFESIKVTRDMGKYKEQQKQHLQRQFDLVRVGNWTIQGSIHGQLVELRASNNEQGREIVKRYPYEKVAHKLEEGYQQWLRKKFGGAIQ